MKKSGNISLISALLLLALGFSGSVNAQESPPKFLYGVSSWYGEQFEGRLTASGERFSLNALTAAHKTLPFGSRVEIENLGNGKKVEVIINDRGPYAENRVLDVSKRVAEILDFVNEGKAFVKITIKELGDPVNKPMNIAPQDREFKSDVPKNFSPPMPNSTTPALDLNSNAALGEEAVQDTTAPLQSFDAPELDEADFMNDTPPVASQEAPLRTQDINQDPFGSSAATPLGLTNFSSNYPSAPMAFDPLDPAEDPDLTSYSNVLTNIDVEPQDSYEPDPFANLADPFNTFPKPTNDVWHRGITPDALNPNAGKINDTNISQNIGRVEDFKVDQNIKEPEPAPVVVKPTPEPVVKVPDTAVATIQDNTNMVTVTNEVVIVKTNMVDTYPDAVEDVEEAIEEYQEPEDTEEYQKPIVNTEKYQKPVEKEEEFVAPTKLNTAGWLPNPPDPAVAKEYYIIQVGAFSSSANAMTVYNILKNQKDKALANVYTADVKVPVKKKGISKIQNVMRVRLGFFLNAEEALAKSEEVDALLKKHLIKSSVVKVDYTE